MISAKNPLALRALRLIRENDGDLCAADVGAHLWPPPKLTGTGDYLAWRASLRLEVKPRGKHIDVRSLSEADRNARASRLLRRMAEAGLIESRGRPVLADWFVAKWEARTARVREDWRALGYDMEPTYLAARSDALVLLASKDIHRRGIIYGVAQGPSSVADVLGPKPSGATKRAWSALCDEGIVLPPARRWITNKGRAALGERAPCGCAPGEDCLRCKFP